MNSLQNKLLETLKSNGSLNIYNLISRLNKPKTTLVDNLYKLECEGLVKVERFNNHMRGRPVTYWRVIE